MSLLPALLAAAPYVPASDSEVLYQLPAGAISARQGSNAPADPAVAAVLARAWIERARHDGDPRFLGYAEGVLAPWWNDSSAPEGIPLLRAIVFQSRHRFDDSLAELEAILRSDPGNAQALLTRATVLRVLGRLAEARDACDSLIESEVGLAAAICLASIDSLNGRLPAAIAAMDRIEARIGDADRDLKNWFFSERADMALRAGEPETALQWLRRPLEMGDASARTAAVDLLLDSGRLPEAIELLGQNAGGDGLLLRLAIASRALGEPRLDIERRLTDAYASARRRGDSPHLREEAMFELSARGDAVRALALARDNWATQREPADALLLAQAAVAADKPEAVVPLLAWLQQTSMQDVRLEAALARLSQ